MKLPKYLLTLLTTLCLAAVAVAQPAYRVRTFNIHDGLAANFISGMCQTSDGMVWVSTWNGLNCYDGYQFTTFRGQPETGEVLTTNRIIRIEANTRDNVWCVTFDRNLYLFDTHECRFVDASEIVRQKYGIEIAARNIYAMKGGVTWVTCDHETKALLRVDDSRPLDSEAVQLMQFDEIGLDCSYVNKVVEDNDHREWIITDRGVVLWESQGLQSPSDLLRIPHHYEWVEQLRKRVYMVAPDGRLGYWQPGQQQLTAVSLSPAPTKISALVRCGSDRLLMATDRGVMAIESDGRVTTLSPMPATDIFTDSKQRIWAFGADRAVQLIGSDGTARQELRLPLITDHTSFTLSERNSHPLWMEDKEGTVWMACANSPLCHFDETRQEMRADTGGYPYGVRAGTEPAPTSVIDRYLIDSQRNLWFSSTHDLSLLTFRHQPLRFVEVSKGQETRALCYDRQGRLWAGTANGYVKVFGTVQGDLQSPSPMGWLSPAGTLQQQPVKFANKVYALFFDSKDRLWIGTKGQGLYCVQTPGTTNPLKQTTKGGVLHFMPREGDIGSLSSDEVYAIDEDELHQLWVGTYGGGVNLVQETGGPPLTSPQGRGNGSIFFINSNGTLEGYDMVRYGKIRRISHDGKGHILLSTTGGLVMFPNRRWDLTEKGFRSFTHVKGNTTSLLTVDVMQTCVTRQGKVLVATMGGGMQEYRDTSFHRMAQFTPDEGNVIDMVEDRDGRVWVVRETTLNRYDPQTGEVLGISPETIGADLEFSEAQPACDATTGRIAVAALGGFVVFDPQQIRQSDDSPRIVFTSVRYHGEQTVRPLLNTPLLHVASDRRNLTISFAALAYGDNGQVSYAYRLESGIANPLQRSDDEWNYVGTSHLAQFNHLPAGRHRLLVRSTNSDGKWQDNVEELIIEAEPTFWESWMGTLLKVLAVIAVVLVAFHIWRLRQQIKLERQMNRMKSEFYGDVTQELREPLTQIGDIAASGIANPLQQAEEKAQQMLAMVDEKINEYQLAPPEIIDEDKQMMEQLMAYLEEHIGDSDMKVEDMAAAVNMGRSVFYSKVRAMTGMAPVDFVRQLRIRRAAELLERSQYTISQIAYQVGFTDPKYFSKCFKKDTGQTPSEYREKPDSSSQTSISDNFST